jgi:hypothetical protein
MVFNARVKTTGSDAFTRAKEKTQVKTVNN